MSIRFNVSTAAGIGAVMVVLSVNAHAGDGVSTGDVVPPASVQTVVVTASRSQARVQDMPLSTTIISSEQIQKSPAQTLDQLLRSVPGLNFSGVPETQSDPTGQQTKMRGLGNAKVLVLLDGVPMMDPFYLTTQWFKAPLSNIDHIEIIRGGNSSLWGNMAVAGVINIVSKRPVDGSGEISASLGYHGSTNFAVSKNWVVSDALRFNLSLDQLDSKGYNTLPGSQLWRYPGWQPTTAKETNVQLTAFFKPSDDLRGYLRFGYHIQDQNINYLYGENKQTSPDMSGSVTKRLENRDSITATAWAQQVDFAKFNGASCYLLANQSQVNGNVVQYYTQNSAQDYHEQGASVIYSKELTGLVRGLQLGADVRHLSATDNETFFAAPTALTQLQNFNSRTYGTGDQTFSGIFTQVRLVPVDTLEITFSARADNWSNTHRAGTRTNTAGVTVGGAEPNVSRTAFDPSLAARYDVNDDLAFRGAVYKAFRGPGFNNTMRTYGSPAPTIANPDLSPENLTGREIGLDFHQGPVALSATYFQYDITNMIATYKISAAQYASAPALVQTICGAGFVNCGGSTGSASFYTNDQNGQSHGLELSGRWTYSPTLNFDASYTRTQTILTSESVSITTPLNMQLAGTPVNTANASVTWRPASAWQTYLAARYIGAMYYDVTTAGGPYAQGGTVVFDGSIRYAVSPSTAVIVSGINLANRGYNEGTYTVNQPWGMTLSQPRTVTATVRVQF